MEYGITSERARMTDEQVDTFLALVRARSVTGAADLVRCAQATASERLRALERELGTPLYRRRGRGVELTAAGRAAAAALPSVRAARDAARGRVRAAASGLAARLELAVCVTAGAYCLAPAFVAFRARRADVEVAVRSVHSDDALGLLLAGTVDLAVTSAPLIHPRVVRLGHGSRPMVLVGAPRSALARRPVDAAALRSAALLTSSWGPAYARFLDDVRGDAPVPPTWTEASPIDLAKALVEAGAGVSLLPRVAVRAELEAGRLVALRTDGLALPRWSLHLSTRHGRDDEPLVALAGALRGALGEAT